MSHAEAFDRIVNRFLAEELHDLRGMTSDEYVAACRMAWDACKINEEFPLKVLHDPLRPPSNYFAEDGHDYVHWRALEALGSTPHESTEIYCIAVGEVKLDFTPQTADEPPLPTEEPDVPEIRRYALAIFDILGFSAYLASKELPEVLSLYDQLIAGAVTKDAVRTANVIRLNRNESSSIYFNLPVRYAYFSDTILLWVPLVQHFIAPFIARCADLVCDALKVGVPLRGALGVGPAVLHSRTGTFLGKPIVEVARLEQAQNWLGVTFGLSMLAADVSREFDPNLVLPYRTPTKRNKAELSSGLVLDWPRRFVSRHGGDPLEALAAVNTSPAHSHYYDNAAKFVKFSQGPLLRREGMQPAVLTGLTSAAVEAQAGNRSLSGEHKRLLRDLRNVGEIGTSVAAYVEAIAQGMQPGKPPANLPPNLRRLLRDMSLAARGSAKYFKLTDLAVQALRARQHGLGFREDDLRRLEELEAYGSDTAAVARFFRDLAAGAAISVPKGLSRQLRGFLEDVVAWSDGKVPWSALEHLCNEVLAVRFEYAELSDYDRDLIELITNADGPWPQIASFLRDLMNPASTPSVPVGLPTALRRHLTRIALAAQPAKVQSPRLLELISVGFGDPSTGVNLFALIRALAALQTSRKPIPPQLLSAVSTFESAAEERILVGEHLRALAHGTDPGPLPAKLPVALHMLMHQMRAVFDGRAIPVDPQLVGWASIRNRHSRGEFGDCIRFSLDAMLGANEEYHRLAQYFLRLSAGGPAVPVPQFQTASLSDIADEMRCLADTSVGGIRLLMRPGPGRIPQAAVE